MFSSALIVFRETLEAALFVGIIAAATRQIAGRARWLNAGIGAGVLGALVLALLAERMAAWNEGTGQDMANIAILGLALVMLVWHSLSSATQGRQMALEARELGSAVEQGQRPPWALFVATALAVLREGAETVLFVSGSITGPDSPAGATVLLSCVLGLAAGAAVGALVYFGLSRFSLRGLFNATNVLIAFLAASIASQLAKALAQAGLLERWTTPLWDSSALVASDSAMGTLLHALLGYDARPSGVQVASYAAVLLLILVGARWARVRREPPKPRAFPRP